MRASRERRCFGLFDLDLSKRGRCETDGSSELCSGKEGRTAGQMYADRRTAPPDREEGERTVGRCCRRRRCSVTVDQQPSGRSPSDRAVRSCVCLTVLCWTEESTATKTTTAGWLTGLAVPDWAEVGPCTSIDVFSLPPPPTPPPSSCVTFGPSSPHREGFGGVDRSRPRRRSTIQSNAHRTCLLRFQGAACETSHGILSGVLS